MATASYNGTTVAEETNGKRLVHLEGNVYFSADAVKSEYLKESTHTSVCPAKGTANYYDVVVGEKAARNAAWVYRTPNSTYSNIKDRLAFWNGVNVRRDDSGGAVASNSGIVCCVLM